VLFEGAYIIRPASPAAWSLALGNRFFNEITAYLIPTPRKKISGMRFASLAILFNGPPLHPSDRVRWRCVCVVITLKCAFYYYYCGQVPYADAVPLYTHTYTTAVTTLRIVYLYTCARAFLLILLLIHVFCCNTGPAPDGLTRFSYLLCTGRVARAVSRRFSYSSLLSNGFAAVVVPDLSYANNIYVHTSLRYTYPTHLTDVVVNGFRKRLVRRYASEKQLTLASG